MQHTDTEYGSGLKAVNTEYGYGYGIRISYAYDCENRCSAHGKDATPKRAAAVPGTYEVGMANAPLGSAGLAVLSAAAIWQELGESCGWKPPAQKLRHSCLEAINRY